MRYSYEYRIFYIVLLTSICVSMSISLVSVAAEGQSKEYPEELVALMKQ